MIGRRKPPSVPLGDDDIAPRGFDDFDLRLGDVMRGERATIGKSLLDVQRDLKIKASYIAAIENCDVGAFETPGFIAGYVRSYARYLGMDPEWAFARFCDEAGFSPLDGISAAAARRQPPGERAAAPRTPLRRPAREPIRGVGLGFAPPRDAPLLSRLSPGALGSITVLALLIGGLGYGGWLVLQEVQRVQVAPVDSVPGVLANLDPLDGVSAPIAEPSPGEEFAAPGSDLLDRLYRPPALDVPVLVARDGPIAAIDPRATGTRVGPNTTAEATADEATEPSVAEAPRVQVVEEGPQLVEVLAVRPAWIRVSAANGTVLFEKILDAGERYVVPPLEEPARLRAGNSGSVYFVINGQAYGPSAPGANIARNVDLSPESLRDSFAVADLDADPDLAGMIAVAEAPADPAD